MTRGFTLLEVSVALAVLALGLVAVVDLNSGAVRLHEQSQRLTLGTLLAKGKMIDLEQKLGQDGFSDFDQQIDGTFDEQGHPEIRWHAEILKPDLTKANDQITQLVTGALGGGTPGGATGSQSGSGSNPLSALLGQSSLLSSSSALPPGLLAGTGSDPSSPVTTGLGGLAGEAMTGLVQAQVTQLVTLIQQGLREARLTVTWPEGRSEGTLSLATHFVILNAPGAGITSAQPGTPPGQGTATPSGSGGLPGSLGGLPGTSPLGGLPGALGGH